MNLLGGLNRSDFLRNYWQKQPLLIRQAMPNFKSPISAEELAGLACEEEAESRLVQEQTNDGPWQCRHGPFNEEDFKNLPETNWTLLVQSVDHHVPEIAALIEQFDFIPAWRLDDVMISYAPVNGSVGPHLDNYDVFLLQAKGKRHWLINESDYSETDFIEGLDLRIIENFQSKKDWILEPGDMLYLPPGVAHHGIALDDCLTYSFGFRAPTLAELWDAYIGHLQGKGKNSHYSDPELEIQEYRGEIKSEQTEKIRQHMLSALSTEKDFASWFGRYISENHRHIREGEDRKESLNDFLVRFKQATRLTRHGHIRMCYLQDKDSILFFYSGSKIELPTEQLSLVRYLSNHYSIDYLSIRDLFSENVEDLALKLLFNLYTQGCFYFDEPV